MTSCKAPPPRGAAISALKLMADAEIQYVSDENGEPTAVTVPFTVTILGAATFTEALISSFTTPDV